MSDNRHKTGKKSESASEMWRRIELNGMEAALKKIETTKTELAVISSLSSDDAANIMGVILEHTETINCIRVGFEENEQELFDNDERESRYLKTTCPAILELWSKYTTFASGFASTFVQKCWLNSSEHRDLLDAMIEVVASSAKLLVVSVNMANYHSLEDASALRSVSIRETHTVVKDLEDTLDNIYNLGEKHSALNAMLELAGWELHGVYHMAENVLKVEVQTRASDSSFDDYKEVTVSTNSLIDKLRQRWSGNNQDNDKEQQQQQQPPPTERKQSKSNKNSKRQTSKVESSPPAIETKPPKEECLETFQKLRSVYNDVNADAWETKRLPVMRGTAGVQMKYRIENYDQIRKFTVNACAVHKRQEILNEMGVTNDYELHSELFDVEPEGLVCDQDVIISFPLTSSNPDSKVFLKVKVNGEWTDIDITDKENVGNQTFVTFTTKCIKSFAATSFNPRDALIVGPSGANYVSEEDAGKVELTIPEDCYSSEVTLGVKTLQFEKRGYDSSFIGTITASVAVEVSLEAGDAIMNKNITLQLPLEEGDNISERDTTLVVVRCNKHSIQVLDKKQLTLKETANNAYSVDVKGYWCLAILRIRRIYLNMRESIKNEFLIGYGIKMPCNIVTFIEDSTRQSEKQTFVMEIVEKSDVDMTVDLKRGFGLIEVKKSRSKDILLKRGEQVAMAIDGQLRVTEVMTEGQNTVCFLPGARNNKCIPTEIKRDPEKLPDAMIFYQGEPDNTVMHSVAIMTRDLSEMATDAIVAKTGLNMNKTDHKQEKQKEEAAVQILKMESLMSLARELTFEEGASLGKQLGVKPGTIKRISEEVEKDRVSSNFQILCSWRGRFARATMADFLVSCLKAVGKLNYADIVVEVRTHNRGLEESDFSCLKARQTGKIY